jgi:hypothetical protein
LLASDAAVVLFDGPLEAELLPSERAGLLRTDLGGAQLAQGSDRAGPPRAIPCFGISPFSDHRLEGLGLTLVDAPVVLLPDIGEAHDSGGESARYGQLIVSVTHKWLVGAIPLTLIPLDKVVMAEPIVKFTVDAIDAAPADETRRVWSLTVHSILRERLRVDGRPSGPGKHVLDRGSGYG